MRNVFILRELENIRGGANIFAGHSATDNASWPTPCKTGKGSRVIQPVTSGVRESPSSSTWVLFSTNNARSTE